MPKMGKTIHKYVHQLPKLELAVHIQPVTRYMVGWGECSHTGIYMYMVGECFGINHTHLQLLVDLL